MLTAYATAGPGKHVTDTRDFRGVREVVLVYSKGTALAYRTRDMLEPDRS